MTYLIIVNLQLFKIFKFFNQFIIFFDLNNFKFDIIFEVCICYAIQMQII
jgi:hypothetical protein